jgi:hypothetical protein
LTGWGGGVCCLTGYGYFLGALSPNILRIAAFFFGSGTGSTFFCPWFKLVFDSCFEIEGPLSPPLWSGFFLNAYSALLW